MVMINSEDNCNRNLTGIRRISIIIPAYNAEKHIRRCINSVLPQLSDDDEIILINDGSTDDTLSIMNEYASENRLVRIIDKENEGVAKTRNRGIVEARGTYICFIDDDDFIDDDYIDTMFSNIDESGVDLVLGGYRRVSDSDCLYTVKGVESEWYKYMVVAPWGRIYRKQLLLDENIRFLEPYGQEDVFFNIQCYHLTKKVKVIPYVGYNWYFNDKSISNTMQKGFKDRDTHTLYWNSLREVSGEEPIVNRFFVRNGVFYLLHSGKTATSKAFVEEYNKVRSWYKDHKIGFSFPMIGEAVKGEPIKNRIIIWFFIMLCKTGLVRCFAHLYCKGKADNSEKDNNNPSI